MLSKGELQITSILEKYNIHYFSQYKFDKCKDTCKLPFDFYLPDKNTCIEFDGIHHYKPINRTTTFDKTFKDFNNTMNHDQIKNQFCIDYGIHLIRIPYWEFKNIETIIVSKLGIE